MRAADAVGLWLLAIAASAAVGTAGPVYWDAGDYVRLAIEGGPSGLALGRPLFLFVSRAILDLGVDPASAEAVLRWFWAVFSATAAPAMAWLALRLGLDRNASVVAGAALALSPSFAHTSHQVLTDGPALALSIAALVAASSSRAVLAGVLLAAAIMTRETAAVHVVAVALLLGRRAIVALVVTAAAIAAIIWMFPPPALAQWFQSMARSTASERVGAWQMLVPFIWVLAAGPVPVIVGIVVLARRPAAGRWLAVSVPAAVATIGLLFYPDGSFSPRYMLATVPLAFFPAAASWLAARPRMAIAALVAPLLLVPVATQPSRAVAARGASVMQRIASLPAGTLLVPGHYCSYARLGATILARRDFDLMCPGWDWPADPARVLDTALASGRPIALDLADDAWIPPREVPNRDAVRAWAAGRAGQNIAGFKVVIR